MESPSLLGTDVGDDIHLTHTHAHAQASSSKSAWYHIRGGYTDTYIHFKTKRVFKYCDRYYNESLEEDTTSPQIIHYSTICDLVFSKMLGQLKGFPSIHRCDILKSKIRMEMDYLGKTLHDAAQSFSKQTRLQLAPRLLDYLVTVCYNLKYNGLQHTDLKPGNILIDSNDHFHLIDFNCMATTCASPGKWCSGIGTWHYVAPEILMTDKPNDTSMVWSIGMVMAQWILGYYPISNERMERYIGIVPTSQSQWKRMMTDIRRKYPDYLQLEQRHLTEINEWWARIHPMLRWNPYKRWSLERLLQSLYPLKIHIRNIIIEPFASPAPSVIPEYIREKTIKTGYRFLKEIHMESLMVNTVTLFDICYPLVDKDLFSPELLYLCAWTIQGYLTNQFLFDNDSIVLAIHQYFRITCDVILANVYTVLKACHYAAWQKEWYMYLNSIPSEIQWDVVVGILIEYRKPYCPEDIARMYLERIKQQHNAHPLKDDQR